jgi:hypothetical protein
MNQIETHFGTPPVMISLQISIVIHLLLACAAVLLAAVR